MPPCISGAETFERPPSPPIGFIDPAESSMFDPPGSDWMVMVILGIIMATGCGESADALIFPPAPPVGPDDGSIIGADS